uniref:Uncharacterized protein n=1 Tax=Rhizophora mucronata TaxID=61149 RepID=A0A2P2IPD8_RHIMU
MPLGGTIRTKEVVVVTAAVGVIHMGVGGEVDLGEVLVTKMVAIHTLISLETTIQGTTITISTEGAIEVVGNRKTIITPQVMLGWPHDIISDCTSMGFLVVDGKKIFLLSTKLFMS